MEPQRLRPVLGRELASSLDRLREEDPSNRFESPLDLCGDRRDLAGPFELVFRVPSREPSRVSRGV